jgi:formamidopyrimidine-DNA glycosylase
MPELAEVVSFCRRWDPGLGDPILRVHCNPRARVFRGVETDALRAALPRQRLVTSATHGKQMIFRFSRAALGVHLGMTGELRVEPADYAPAKHDHLVLGQKRRALVFTDPRAFGQILFHPDASDPPWWAGRPPAVLSPGFSAAAVAGFLARRKGAPLKAVLLMQEQFPGIGNWMADEILWRARLAPARRAGDLTPAEARLVWRETRTVTRFALRTIGQDAGDPPDTWLFPHRWRDGGACPRCGLDLRRAPIGGRTTCWCPRCQR